MAFHPRRPSDIHQHTAGAAGAVVAVPAPDALRGATTLPDQRTPPTLEGTAPTTVKVTGEPDIESLLWDEHSALFWSQHLGRYSGTMRGRVDRYALLAAVISAVTGAAVWVTVSSLTGVWPQLLVTAVAVTSTIVALVPKQLNYGDAADKATGLSVRYLHVLHKLASARLALSADRPGAAELAAAAIAEFEAVRADKEHLRPTRASSRRSTRWSAALLEVGEVDGVPSLVAKVPRSE